MTDFTRARMRRELHVLDVENLLGGTYFALPQVRQLRSAYAAATTMARTAQVVVAASAEQSAITTGLGWPGSSLRMRRGRDGADLALVDLLEHENVAARFGRVYIGSGDGIFAPVAATLAGDGVQVTAVSRRDALSRSLRMACTRVIYLEALQPTPSRPYGRAA